MRYRFLSAMVIASLGASGCSAERELPVAGAKVGPASVEERASLSNPLKAEKATGKSVARRGASNPRIGR